MGSIMPSELWNSGLGYVLKISGWLRDGLVVLKRSRSFRRFLIRMQLAITFQNLSWSISFQCLWRQNHTCSHSTGDKAPQSHTWNTGGRAQDASYSVFHAGCGESMQKIGQNTWLPELSRDRGGGSPYSSNTHAVERP